MQAFKDAKRRIVQQTVESLGKAERVTKDEEAMKEALEGFKSLEQQLKALYEQLKGAQAATAKWTERNLILAESMSNFFADDSGPLKNASLHVSSSALRAHEIVQRSAAKVVENRGILILENLMNERIPALKKKIAEHANLETDVSSYTRRHKTMAEKKPPSDPEVVKVKEKLDRAMATYERVHADLLEELTRLLKDRFNLVRPVFVAVVVAQCELQKVLSQEFNQAMQVVDGPDVSAIKEEIKYLVESGGPPFEGTSKSGMGTLPSMKSLFNKKDASHAPSAPSGNINMSSSPQIERPTYTTPSYSAPSYTTPSTPQQAIAPPSYMNKAPPPPPPEPAEDQIQDEHIPEAREIEPSDQPLVPGCIGVAIFDYDGPDPGDLSFKVDDRIRLEVEVSPGWWNGTREEDGSYGLFPETYIRRVE